MAGKRNGPRPAWDKYTEEQRAALEERRKALFEYRDDERELAKMEAFMQANQQAAGKFLKHKLEFINAMLEEARDRDTGEIDPSRVAAMGAKDKKVLLQALELVEKSAGFQQRTTEHKHTHTVSLADEFKQLQRGEDSDVIEAEVVHDY